MTPLAARLAGFSVPRWYRSGLGAFFLCFLRVVRVIAPFRKEVASRSAMTDSFQTLGQQSMKKTYILSTIASLALVSPALAATAITGFTGGSTFTGFNSDETIGWTFSTGSALSVTSIGWFSTDGSIDANHQIGIWDSMGSLLGSATVTPGAPDGTGFRYTSVTPFSLASGQQYFIGGRDLIGDGDNYISSVSSLTTNSAITFLGTARSSNGSGFAFPNIVNNVTLNGRFGPNFQFDVNAVPEPATWGMMILGFGMVGGAMRRRAKISVTYA
jgi:hypothetical protein